MLTGQREYGEPQEGTISPILSNIYLHELDKFMEKKVEQSKETGKTSVPNPEYKKIHTKISNLRQYFLPSYRYNRKLDASEVEERKRVILQLEKERSKIPSTIRGQGYRIYYVRYADDFLIGINGTRTQAKNLKKEIKEFLREELKLILSTEKTKVTSAITNRASFLGAEIRALTSRTNDQKSYTKDGRLVRARTTQGNIIVLAPIEKIVRRLADQGMCNVKDFKNRIIIPKKKSA